MLKLHSDTTQGITNVLRTLDFLQSTHRVVNRTKNHLTAQKTSRTPILYGLPKIYTFNLPLTLIEIFLIFFIWDSLHARLNSHYKAQSYKKKEEQKDKKHTGKLFRKTLQIKGLY